MVLPTPTRSSGRVPIDGIAASIASMIAMAGDEVVMPENAMLMLHDPSGLVMGSKGTCGNRHRIRRKDLEHRVLEGLKHRLLAPEQVEMFTRMFQEEFNRLAAEKMQSRAADEGRLQIVQRKIASLIRAIEDGLYQPSMKERMAGLEAEKAGLMKRLAAPKLSSIRFHPNLAQQYRKKISNLEKVLANPATHPETVASIRRQVERITLTPNAEGNLDIHLYACARLSLRRSIVSGDRSLRHFFTRSVRRLSAVTSTT